VYGKIAASKMTEPVPKQSTHAFLKTKASKAKTSPAAVHQSLQCAIAFNAMHHQADPIGSFRDAKNELVSNFERTYITQALTKHSGNIAMAARASNKHRRAFWALMRKHDIAAEPYRTGDDEE
jgi:DNA-binding NtrC family response regulator